MADFQIADDILTGLHIPDVEAIPDTWQPITIRQRINIIRDPKERFDAFTRVGSALMHHAPDEVAPFRELFPEYATTEIGMETLDFESFQY